jgi:hypothetical protein
MPNSTEPVARPVRSLREHIEDYTLCPGVASWRGPRFFALLDYRGQLAQAYEWLGINTSILGTPLKGAPGSLQTDVAGDLRASACGMTDQWELIVQILRTYLPKGTSEFVAIALDGTVRPLANWREEAVIAGPTVQYLPEPGPMSDEDYEDLLADRANERYYADLEENPEPYRAMFREAVRRTTARASR